MPQTLCVISVKGRRVLKGVEPSRGSMSPGMAQGSVRKAIPPACDRQVGKCSVLNGVLSETVRQSTHHFPTCHSPTVPLCLLCTGICVAPKASLG